MKYLIRFAILSICAYGCSHGIEKSSIPKKFETFEISFSNGWTTSLSFLVDTNKIYFSPQKSDTSVYGILPDSIFHLIDSACSEILDGKIISKDRGCLDCPILAVQVVTKTDTVHVKQRGDIDHLFLAVIKNMQAFLKSGKHSTIRSALLLPTQKTVSYPVPPVIDSNSKSLTPKKKRGN